jgi:hypothetical protein
MAIEEELQALTAAVKANTEALLASNALRETAIGAVKEAAAAGAGAKKTETKKADAAPSTATTTKPATDGLITDAEGDIVRTQIQTYLKGADRDNEDWAKAEREARRVKVRALLSHEKVLAPGVTFDPQNIQMAAAGFKIFEATIKKFIAEGDLTTAPADAGGDTLDL